MIKTDRNTNITCFMDNVKEVHTRQRKMAALIIGLLVTTQDYCFNNVVMILHHSVVQPSLLHSQV